MEKLTGDTSFYRILVAIETDATRFYGANATRPGVLGASDSEQLLAHVAADLKALFPEVSNCSLIVAGALFDQTQVLRPSYPVFRGLESASTGNQVDRFEPRLVSIAAQNGMMPNDDLQPLPDIPLGLLQLLPVIVQGPASLVSELGELMEYRFLEEGQISAHSAAWMETAFSVSVNHARFMTLTDLNAMLRLQLEHRGFLPMWELLDAALNGQAGSLQVSSDSGQVYEWKDGAVWTCFETFDHWSNSGGGAKVDAARQVLAAAYGDWTRETRQYLTTLSAHGLDVRFTLAGSDDPLAGTFLTEPGISASLDGDSSITEHSYAELGTIAVTACSEGEINHYYPLNPGGLNDIHAHIRDNLPGVHTVAFPGTILYDEKSRCLVPDTGQSRTRH
jgi:hypothetical protein